MYKFDADNPLIDDGVWSSFNGSEFLISHISSDKFQRALAKYQQPHRKAIDEKRLDPVTGKDLLCKAMSEGLLLDWKNVGSSDGQVTKYTSKAGYQALKRDPQFRDFVTDVASEVSNFIQSELDEVGNGFVSGSPGIESGVPS
jgi:hypothetical protein